MSQTLPTKQSLLPLALALAMATTACTYRTPIRVTPVTSAACAIDGPPRSGQTATSESCTRAEPEYPPRRNRRFSWGKALALGLLLPSLLAVDVAVGSD